MTAATVLFATSLFFAGSPSLTAGNDKGNPGVTDSLLDGTGTRLAGTCVGGGRSATGPLATPGFTVEIAGNDGAHGFTSDGTHTGGGRHFT